MKNINTKKGTRSPKYRAQSAEVFSYHSSRNRADDSDHPRGEQSSPLGKKSNRLRHIPTIAAFLAIIVSCLYASSLDVSKPSVVQLSGNSSSILRSDDEYQQGIAEILSESLWSRSKLTINTDKIAKQVKDKYAELGAVAVTLPLLGRRPVVQLSPALPIISVSTKSESYAVSEEGRALMATSKLSEEVRASLIKVTDSLDIDVEQGDYVLPKNTIGFIKDVKFQFDQKGRKIESITLPVVANELHVKLEGQSYIIKFNLLGDAHQQVGSYLALTESLSSSNKPQPKEYVDVRVDGRAYYK